MHPFHVLLSVFTVAALLAFAVLIRWERRRFFRMGKGTAWLKVRLATIPIALGIALSVVAHALQPFAWQLLRSLGKT